MEEGKLLFILVLLFLSLNVNADCCGTSSAYVNNIQDESQILVFVSSSMPISSLQSYVKEAQKYNAVLVIRGLIDGSFIKTTIGLPAEMDPV